MAFAVPSRVAIAFRTVSRQYSAVDDGSTRSASKSKPNTGNGSVIATCADWVKTNGGVVLDLRRTHRVVSHPSHTLDVAGSSCRSNEGLRLKRLHLRRGGNHTRAGHGEISPRVRYHANHALPQKIIIDHLRDHDFS